MEEEWSTDANEALELALLSPETGKQIASFHPNYTYPIFGEAETIFGYKGLNMRLAFAANDMQPCFHAAWEERMEPKGTVKAEDLEELIKDFLPDDYEKDPEKFETSIPKRKLPPDWTPPGELMSSYTLKGKQYEIWHSTMDNDRCKDLLANVQILVTLYIEGGTIISLDDEEWTQKRWEVFFLYERSPSSSYIFVGYCTCYRYFLFNAKESAFSRIRISQFLVLPPFQRMGHGKNLYDQLIEHFLSTPTVREITVEDPSESFQDLRDVQDLRRLTSSGAFDTLTTNSIAKKSFPAAAIRARAKLPERQFARVVELKLLENLDKKDKRAYKIYRLLVKGRIYKQNKDALAQLDRLDRIDKLHDTYVHVEDDYYRLLGLAASSTVQEDAEPPRDKRGGEDAAVRPSKRAKLTE